MPRQPPSDPVLYEKIKRRVRSKVRRWPSAYASGQLVQQYTAAFAKRHPGQRPYRQRRARSTPLGRWFREKWVDLCRPRATTRGAAYAPCGRDAMKGKYPFCRPTRRVSKNTPMTVGEVVQRFGKQKIAERCKEKQAAKKDALNNINK